MMKRKIRYDRLALLVGIVISFLLVIFLGIKLLFLNGNDKNPSKTDDPVNSTPSGETTNDVNFTLDDYNIYASDKLDFRFIVADMTVKSKDGKGIDFEMSKLETNELIQLNNIASYISKFQEAGYSIAKLNLADSIKSDSSEMKIRLFIPVTKRTDSLVLNNMLNSEQITFDLSKEAKDIEEFKNTSGEVISDGKSFDIYVSNAYVSTSMYRDSQEYTYPSTIKVFTYKLNINKLEKEGISIEEAYFIPDGTDEKYKALDASFSSLKDDNIIGIPLKVNDTYALFFELYNPDENNITYNGKLQLKFSNSEQIVEVSTVIQ